MSATMRILARTKTVLQPIELELLAARVPYRLLSGIQFADRREIKDFLAFWKWYLNPANTMALTRFSKAYKLGLVHKKPKAAGWQLVNELRAELRTLTLAKQLTTAMHKLNVEDVLRDELDNEDGESKRVDNIYLLIELFSEQEGATIESMLDDLTLERRVDEPQSGVLLQTIHSAKGQEADYLVLAGLNEGTLPFYKSTTPAELNEERRLAFVAITRTKHSVLLTSSAYQRGFYREPSSFLQDLKPFIEEHHVH